jgi:hypothetical protein
VKHIWAIILKYLMVLIVLEIVLSLATALTIGEIAIISIAVTVLSYLVGDLLILSFSNNFVATVADAVLAFLTIYMFNFWSDYGVITVWDAVISAVVLAVGEWFFHKYMVKVVYPNRNREHRHHA